MLNTSAARIEKTLRHLTDDIGIRLAGSENCWKAIQDIKKDFSEFCPQVEIEEFPLLERHVERESLEIELDGQWHAFRSSLFSSAAVTGGQQITADIVLFDGHTGYQMPDLSFLAGKAVVHLGAHFAHDDDFRRIIQAKPAFLLMVDTRYPLTYPIADGLFPALVKKYGTMPITGIAYADAMEIISRHATRARFSAEGGMRPGVGGNVIATFPGTDPDADKGAVIYFSAHTDTQAGTVGANDNACGIATIMELARQITSQPHRHTYKFIAFDAEEQLSVGSAAFVRRHRQELQEHGGFVCNFDSNAAAIGWEVCIVNTADEIQTRFTEALNRNGIYYDNLLVAEPFMDQFAFQAAGLPAIGFSRHSCNAGSYHHHQASDVPEHVDCARMALQVKAVSEFIRELDDTDISQDIRLSDEIQKCWNDIYGGWEPK